MEPKLSRCCKTPLTNTIIDGKPVPTCQSCGNIEPDKSENLCEFCLDGKCTITDEQQKEIESENKYNEVLSGTIYFLAGAAVAMVLCLFI